MAILDDSYALITRGAFQIAAYIPHVTVEALAQDALGITGYPVETGATLTDHSFKLPARCEMVVGWSNSSARTEGYIQQIYAGLLRLQATRRPFDIYTSRRVFKNMLMESIVDPQTKDTFNAMVPRIAFRELLISRTRAASGGTTAAAAGNDVQAMPQTTGSTVDRGTVQPELVNFSGASATPFGGYDPSLGIGSATAAGSLGGITVDGVGTFDNSGLGENTSTTDPSALGGNAGLFGRYAPSNFLDVQPFRI